MNKSILVIITLLIAFNSQSIFSQDVKAPENELLSMNLKGVMINKVENYYYRFEKGQPAAEHFHLGPVFGYVVKGKIIYQVEDNKPVVLQAGDAFYEPVGKKIKRFDNGSEKEEAVFIDLSLLKSAEPPIQFEKTPSGKYDIRLLQKQQFDFTVNRVVVSKASFVAGETRQLDSKNGPVLGFVVKGEINYKVSDTAFKLVRAGEGFYEPEGEAIVFSNSSSDEVLLVNFSLY